ncbi:UDP-N-acetylmuramoyl-L-alanine--D-glutamate ligase [Flagellatimonas centrodinii]|uniref:UDP-N-acetylmuramoyl-L-alanine--D-glutamate ligase n=1 Tax=Flagellatimonas centrodinii TaxID=2806210 RepID=UPI001FED2F0F|nr:UDP-N-acetylmuramoyl-L-alanine--D-glutamate ligase [Flagellatimonas centrodinii]ULQ47104.1 UDP-N-acetylmuramoyl-L-alanine--D-glutamate ligase [Flagellatimonas centrodinii]
MNAARQTLAEPYRDQPVLVVGLGLSGTSALRYLMTQGARVTVTDSRAAPVGIDALRAAYPQATFSLGAFAVSRPLADFALAVVSPGIDLREPFVVALRAAGVPVVGDVELFARAVSPAARVVGITGSNGKSTVTTLLGEMARAAGRRVAVGGNLGTPALDLLADGIDLYVLELSSFQLDTTDHLRCDAAAYLNLSEDHLDRHGTMAQYAAAKARIFRNTGTAVVNRDDPAVMAAAAELPDDVRVISFGLDTPADGAYGIRGSAADAWLCRGAAPLMPHASLRIAGLHNAANALAALALADAVGLPEDASRAALQTFAGLPHRCRLVRELRGVRYINDSKGTNVGSTLAAIKGLPAPIHWLGGGQGKGQDFTPLGLALNERNGHAYLFGEDAAVIEASVRAQVPVTRVLTLEAAVTAAHSRATPGATVLLSPACASLDQFHNYIERGERFEQLVEALA